MEAVKGQMVVLHAWYSPKSDISKNCVTWQFFGNGTKPVRKSEHERAVICSIVDPAEKREDSPDKGIIIQYSVLADPPTTEVKVLRLQIKTAS